ncbi:hypothetical protein TNCV_2338991 [Trichonephila clavipes]|nr:hypothetical protein TNCV_2338991 [Trichonephila clavipes]
MCVIVITAQIEPRFVTERRRPDSIPLQPNPVVHDTTPMGGVTRGGHWQHTMEFRVSLLLKKGRCGPKVRTLKSKPFSRLNRLE